MFTAKRQIKTIAVENLSRALRHRMLSVARPLVLLHIGKTGGMSLRELVTRLDSTEQDRLGVARKPVPLGHGASCISDWSLAERHRRFAFVFREPTARYASGFSSRMRQGRPLKAPGAVRWNSREAAAFAFFASANDCFEALDARDERLRSAALFAMQAVTHIVQDHEFYLGGLDDWMERSKHAYFFCPLDELHSQVHRFFVPGDRFDADGLRSLLPNIHANPEGAEGLSTRALQNLKAVRPSEFALYARLLDDYRTRFAD